MSELSDLIDKLERSAYTGHAQYIGYLCIAWGWLEGSIDAMLHILMGTDDYDTTGAVVYNMDLRDKLSTARALG